MASTKRTGVDIAHAPSSGKQFEIMFGDQRATVVEVGAGLRSYSQHGRDLLDGYATEEVCPSGRGQLLIPWPNRLQDGTYDFDGHHQLPINEISRANAIHGLVRWLPWNVAVQTRTRVVMQQTLYPQPGYPFPLALSVEYALDEDGLSVRMTATNIGRRPCPFGGGAHPYLRVGKAGVDSLVLSLPAASFMRSDGRGLPVAVQSVAGTDLDFRQPRLIGSTRLDHAFLDLERGKDGRTRARLWDPLSRTGVSLWQDQSYPYVMLFTGDDLDDVSRRSLAVEPMTCPPNAFRTGESVTVLEPGQTFSGEWGITSES